MIWHPFTQAKNADAPLEIVKAKQAYLFDSAGKSYLDLIASWWVNLHGHAHPVIAKAIYHQAITCEQVILATMTHQPALQLSQELCQHTQMDYVFFSDNGSTAVEIAMKMSLQYWWNHGQRQKKIFVHLDGGYHGDTFGAMSVGKTSNYYKPFEEYLLETRSLSFPCDENKTLCEFFDLLEKEKTNISAIILEPLVQGAAGMRMYSSDFLEKLCDMARAHDVHVIFDEVMTGFGRTGKMFAKDHIHFIPDFMCVSKGLTGGFLPMAATLATQKIYNAFLSDSFDKAFAHGHSYCGSPLGCAAALASLSLFDDMTWNAIENISLTHQERSFGRSIGTISAFEVESCVSAKAIAKKSLENGFFLRPLGKTLYMIPPYCISSNDLHKAYDFLETMI